MAIQYWGTGIVLVLLLFQKLTLLSTEQYQKIQANELHKIRNLNLRLVFIGIVFKDWEEDGLIWAKTCARNLHTWKENLLWINIKQRCNWSLSFIENFKVTWCFIEIHWLLLIGKLILTCSLTISVSTGRVQLAQLYKDTKRPLWTFGGREYGLADHAPGLGRVAGNKCKQRAGIDLTISTNYRWRAGIDLKPNIAFDTNHDVWQGLFDKK